VCLSTIIVNFIFIANGGGGAISQLVIIIIFPHFKITCSKQTMHVGRCLFSLAYSKCFCFFGGVGGWGGEVEGINSEPIRNVCLSLKTTLLNHVKISKLTSSYVAGKIKADIRINLYILEFVLYFSLFQFTSHHRISVTVIS